MKFVYFGYDFLLDSVHALRARGHELVGIYSFECDNVFNFNAKTTALAKELDIPFSLKKPMPIDIDAFFAQGVECFFSGGYLYKIPPIDEDKAFAINFHPSLLPRGRGMMPSPTILMHEPDAAGFTIHKMVEDFDAGDILMQKPIELSDHDDIETYCAKLVMQAPEAICEIVGNIGYHWSMAPPQDHSKATTFPTPDEEMRTLDWSTSNDFLTKKGRAFGRFGCLASFDNRRWAVYNFKCWDEPHDYKPGEIAAVLSREVVIATRDGFAILKEFQQIG